MPVVVAATWTEQIPGADSRRSSLWLSLQRGRNPTLSVSEHASGGGEQAGGGHAAAGSGSGTLAAAAEPTKREHGTVSSTRVDKWLWAVRAYKTRSAATAACQGGHVTVNGRAAKPSTPVSVGDRVMARTGDRERDLEVVRIIEKRVGAPVAAECVVDHSPPLPPREIQPPVFERDRGAGRPTKRDRRLLDRHRRGD